MLTESTAQTSSLHADFSEHSSEVLRRLRASLAELLKTLPGKVRSTGDLQKILSVDSKLCWQVMKVAGPGDAMALAPFVPTPVPMRRLAKAAASKGVSQALVNELLAAYEAFEELVSTHAGDRTTFDSMASGASNSTADDDLQPTAMAHRKAAFKAHCHYAGLQLDTNLVVLMIHPGSAPDHIDIAHIRGKFGMCRLHPGADVNVDRFKATASDRNVDLDKNTFAHNKFDPEAFQKYGAPIIPRFSTRPLPQFNTVLDKDGRNFTNLAGDAVGQLNTVNLVFGDVGTNIPMTSPETGLVGFGGAIAVGCPTMLTVVDHVVYRPMFSNLEHRFSTHWQTTTADFSGNTRGPAVAMRERITRIEGGVDGARLLEVPDYLEILQFVCDHRRWNIKDFDVYRVRVEYPLLFTRLWINFEGTPA